jgi:hypothetical protein
MNGFGQDGGAKLAWEAESLRFFAAVEFTRF